MATMLVLCDLAGGCVASDGTLQPKGTAFNRIVADASFDPGSGLKLITDDGRALYAPAAAPPVPQSVLLWQLKVVLAGMPGATTGKTKLDDADDLATSIGGAVALFWDNGKDVSRGSVTLAGLARQIGLTTDAQLDAAFVAANAVALP